MDTSDKPMRYPGPLDLAQAHTRLNHVAASEDGFTRDGPRADNEYRDLGLAAASGGRIGAKHIRAIRPFEQPTGWHWHDMTGHFVVVLKGWITFRFAGIEGDVTVKAGACAAWPSPAGTAKRAVTPLRYPTMLRILMCGSSLFCRSSEPIIRAWLLARQSVGFTDWIHARHAHGCA